MTKFVKNGVGKLNIDVSGVELAALFRILDKMSFDHSEDCGDLDAANIVEAMCVRIVETGKWRSEND